MVQEESCKIPKEVELQLRSISLPLPLNGGSAIPKRKKKRKKAKSRAKNKSLQPEQVRDLSTRWMEDLLGLAVTAP